MSVRYCTSRRFALVSVGSWALTLMVIVYLLTQDASDLLLPMFSAFQHSPPIPASCGQHDRSEILVSVTSANDVSLTFRTVDSVLASAAEDERLQVAVHIPYRLRKQKIQINSYFHDHVDSGRISIHVNPPEPLQPSSHSYVNTTWLHRQRTVDSSYAAQIGADRSRFFLPLAAGFLVNSGHLLDDLVKAVDDSSHTRWSTIDFLQESPESAPAFSGRLFNSTELMRIAIGLKAYRAARPAEEILDQITSTLMVASNRVNKLHEKLFSADAIAPDPVYQNMDIDALKDSTADLDLTEDGWDCLPNQPSKNVSASSSHQYRFAFAIPTAYRPIESPFLLPLLDQLFDQIAQVEPNSVVVVMFMTGGEWESQLRRQMISRFGSNIANDQLRLISAPLEAYPLLDGLRENYGDSPDRVRWRSKQNLDYASLVEASRDLADFMIMMEDDVTLSDIFFEEARNAVLEQSRLHPEWAMIDICVDIGFAGKVFHDHSLWGLEVLLWTFYDELPCDWTVTTSIQMESGYIHKLPYVLLDHKGKGSSTLLEKNIP